MVRRTSKTRGGSPSPLRRIQDLFRAHADATERFFAESAATVADMAEACLAALRAGRKILFFGNGGSAADAQHLAAEFVNRFAIDRPALASIALTTDTSILTSIGNDYSFDRIFARQVEALGQRGDVAVGLSTSGRSPNVLEGLRAAGVGGLVTIGLTGGDGGTMGEVCRHLIVVPSRDTPRIQEVHILVGHIVCQLIDEALFPRK